MYKSKKRMIRILALVLSLTVLSFTMSALATVAPPAAPDGMGTPPEGVGAPPDGGADTMTYDYTGPLNGVLSVCVRR